MEHEKKVVQLVITKYYLLAWVFGIMSWIFLYYNCPILTILSFLVFIGYSVADMFSVPPNWQPPGGFNNDNDNRPTFV